MRATVNEFSSWKDIQKKKKKKTDRMGCSSSKEIDAQIKDNFFGDDHRRIKTTTTTTTTTTTATNSTNKNKNEDVQQKIIVM